MNANAIAQVTETLRKRLEDALSGSGTVFAGPLDDPSASGAALVLLLYRVMPSASLRNSEHRVATGGVPPVEVYRNALPLELYYMLVVGTVAAGAAGSPPLWALGAAMQTLQAEPNLTGAGVSQETVRLSIEPLSTDETSRIWALYPSANFRTSVAYIATPVWIDPERPEIVGGPVVQDQLFAGTTAAQAVA